MKNNSLTFRTCLAGLHSGCASTFLILMLLGDLAFILLHCVNALSSSIKFGLLDLGRERGYGELFQYLKFLWIIALLIQIAATRKAFHYFAWVLVFAYFLFDDAWEIHERAGGLIASNLNFIAPLGLRLQDIGELVVSALAGLLLLAALVIAYKSGSQIFRRLSGDVLLLVLLLIFFGVFLDMVHSAVDMGATIELILAVLEDGGELVAVSLVLWRVFLENVRVGNTGHYLSDLMWNPFRKDLN